jgi:hypothetical protein
MHWEKEGKKSMSHSNQELDKLAIRQLERKIKEAKEEQKLLEKEAKELKKRYKKLLRSIPY